MIDPIIKNSAEQFINDYKEHFRYELQNRESGLVLNVTMSEDGERKAERKMRRFLNELNQLALKAQIPPSNVTVVNRLDEKYNEEIYRKGFKVNTDIVGATSSAAHNNMRSIMDIVESAKCPRSDFSFKENATHKHLSWKCHEELKG